MTRLPRVTTHEIIRVLERKGFVLARQSGSHKIFKNTDWETAASQKTSRLRQLCQNPPQEGQHKQN